MKSESFRKQALCLVLFFAAVAAVFALIRLRSDPAKKQAESISSYACASGSGSSAVFVVVPTSSSRVAFGAAAKSFSAVVIVFSVLMVNPYYAISVVSFVAICDCNLRLRFAVRRLLRRESSE